MSLKATNLPIDVIFSDTPASLSFPTRRLSSMDRLPSLLVNPRATPLSPLLAPALPSSTIVTPPNPLSS